MLAARCVRVQHRALQLPCLARAPHQWQGFRTATASRAANPTSAVPAPKQQLQHASKDLPIPEANHRELGNRLNIYTNHKWSAGSPLFFPEGAHILLKLQDFLRAQYAIFGFQEVITPTIYKQSLWEQSGHWDNYGEDMYEVVGRGASGRTDGKEIGDEEPFGLKPMNCPGHCLLYAAKPRPSSSLPVRYADFSPLHRNEISGALTGLTRVRKFHQDDGHIFCREEQVGVEIQKTLQLIERVYGAFGLGPFSLVLSTRPKEKYVGSVETWDVAEAQLEGVLRASGIDWTMNPGDGAFYGPKIDIILRDRTGKAHQTATIQLDFQLPARFGLQYNHHPTATKSATATPETAQLKQPVLIHRAVLGSLERFLALLLEHTQGNLPLWISPKQVRVLTLRSEPELVAYAEDVAATVRGFQIANEDDAPRLQPLSAERIAVDIDDRAEKISKKVRNAHDEHCCILATIGPEDLAAGLVSANFTRLRNLEAVQDALELAGIPLAVEGAKPRWERIAMTPLQLRNVVCSLTAAYM